MGAGSGDGGGRDEASEAESFEAQIVTDQVLAFVRGVALVEDEIYYFQDRIEPAALLVAARHVEAQVVVANLAFGAYEPLGYGFIIGEEGAGNLAHAEASNRLETQRNARIP